MQHRELIVAVHAQFLSEFDNSAFIYDEYECRPMMYACVNCFSTLYRRHDLTFICVEIAVKI